MVLDRTWKRAGALVALAVGARRRGVRRRTTTTAAPSSGEKRHALVPRRQQRPGRQAGRGADRRVPGEEPEHHDQARDAPAGRRGRQRGEDAALHAGDDRPLRVQLGLAVPGAATRRRSSPRSTTSRGWAISTTRSSRACRSKTRSTARRSAAPSAAASSTTRRSTRSSASKSPDVGRVHGEQRQDQEGRASTRCPELRGHVDLAAVRARRLPQRGGRGPGLGPAVHEQPGQVLAGAGGRGLPAPRGGQQGRLPEQELRLDQVPRRAQPARPGQGRALSAAHGHGPEPRDLGPGQDRRRRLLRPARQERRRQRPHAVAAGRRVRPEDDRGRQARRGEEVPRVRRQPRGLRGPGQRVRADRPVDGQGLRAARRRAGGDQGPPAVRRRGQGHAGARVPLPRQGPGARADHGRGRLRACGRPQDGAKLYDEDVKKQAQQLGLEGW